MALVPEISYLARPVEPCASVIAAFSIRQIQLGGDQPIGNGSLGRSGGRSENDKGQYGGQYFIHSFSGYKLNVHDSGEMK
jgi:hypothetical protein